MGTIAERILAVQGNITKLRDQLTELSTNINDDDPDEASSLAMDELTKKIAIQERHLETLKKAEKQLAVKTANRREENDEDDDETDETTTVLHAREQRGGSSALTITGKRPFAIPAKKVKPVDYLFRALTVKLKHHHQKGALSMVDVLKETYGEDEGTYAVMNMVLRAGTTPARTDTTGWAQELVTVAIGEFFGLLLPVSVYAQLSALGGRFTFGPNGILSLPTRSSTPTVGGAFVGQGAPIPVKQGAFTAITMVPKKVGVISTFTREIAEHSTPSIEMLVRDAITEDTAIAIDSVLLDNNVATAIRPQGLQNAATTQTADAAGTTALDKLIADIKTMTNALFSVTNGNVRTPVWIMNPAVANNISLMTVASIGNMPFREEIGQGRLAGYPIIKSTNSAVDTWWLVDAADFISAAGDVPRFDVSDQAVLHMEDTTPLDVTTAAVGTSVKSLWQTDSIGVRMLMDLNWALRRTGMVQYMTAHGWE